MTDTDALTERIARALSDSVGGWNKDTAAIQRSATAILPIIRAAQADAWSEGAHTMTTGAENDWIDEQNPYRDPEETP